MSAARARPEPHPEAGAGAVGDAGPVGDGPVGDAGPVGDGPVGQGTGGGGAGERAQDWTRAAQWVAEEAFRLFDAVQRAGAGHEGPQCRVCPVCQGIAAARRVRPDAVERVADALSELAAALRETARAAPPPDRPPPDRPPARPPEPTPVEHIDLTD